MEFERFVTEKEAASFMSLSTESLRRMRYDNLVPYYTNPNGRPRYLLSELRSFYLAGCPVSEADHKGATAK